MSETATLEIDQIALHKETFLDPWEEPLFVQGECLMLLEKRIFERVFRQLFDWRMQIAPTQILSHATVSSRNVYPGSCWAKSLLIRLRRSSFWFATAERFAAINRFWKSNTLSETSFGYFHSWDFFGSKWARSKTDSTSGGISFFKARSTSLVVFIGGRGNGKRVSKLCNLMPRAQDLSLDPFVPLSL